MDEHEDDYESKQTKFSTEAEELLQTYRKKLKPKVCNVAIQTDVSDVMQALQTLQQQKNALQLELQQCRHDLAKKDHTIANIRASMNERLEAAEEKVSRLQTRNTAIENLVSFRRNEEAILRTPTKSSDGTSTTQFVDTEGLSGSAKVKIRLLEKRLVHQQSLEEKIMHLEKRNIDIARERGVEKLELLDLESEISNAKRQKELAVSEKNIAQEEASQLREQYKTLQNDFQTLDALSKKQGQDIHELRESHLQLKSHHDMETAKFQKIITMLRDYGHRVRKDYQRHRAKSENIYNQFVAIKKQLLRSKGFIFSFPNIAALRQQIVSSVENIKTIMVAQEKVRLEKKFKRNIIRTKQLEIQNEECKELLRVRNEELKECRQRLMKITVDSKLQSKVMEEVTKEVSELRSQQVSRTKSRNNFEIEINRLTTEKQEAEISVNELEIRNGLLNKLLTAERENNKKYEEIMLSKRPEIESLKIKLVDMKRKYDKMVLKIEELSKENVSKKGQCLDLQSKNETLRSELTILKNVLREGLNNVLMLGEEPLNDEVNSTNNDTE